MTINDPKTTLSWTQLSNTNSCCHSSIQITNSIENKWLPVTLLFHISITLNVSFCFIASCLIKTVLKIFKLSDITCAFQNLTVFPSHRSPLRRCPLALTWRAGAVFGRCWASCLITCMGFIWASDLSCNQSPVTTFSWTLHNKQNKVLLSSPLALTLSKHISFLINKCTRNTLHWCTDDFGGKPFYNNKQLSILYKTFS